MSIHLHALTASSPLDLWHKYGVAQELDIEEVSKHKRQSNLLKGKARVQMYNSLLVYDYLL